MSKHVMRIYFISIHSDKLPSEREGTSGKHKYQRQKYI